MVSLLGYLISQDEHPTFLGQLRNLSFYVHRSYLLLTQCLMERFPTDQEQLSQNVWALALSKLINNKCGGMKKKPGHSNRAERVKGLR